MPRRYASGWRPTPEIVSALEGIPPTVEKQHAEGKGGERGPELSLERPAGIVDHSLDRSHEAELENVLEQEISRELCGIEMEM